MSNTAVGNVYQLIIEEVINSSRVDFEENGVEESVLEELRLGWQQKLSQLDVARFPWDPKPPPEPPAPAAQAPPAAAPAPSSSAQPHFSPPLSSIPEPSPTLSQNGAKTEPSVKQEPGIKQEPGTMPMPPAIPNYGNVSDKNNVAANRAQQQLQAQYGNRAAGSINAIQQDRMSQQPRPQGQQQPHQSPPQQTPVPNPILAQQQQQQQLYRQQMAAQTAQLQQQQQQQQQSGGSASTQNLANGQTDGAGDEADDEDFEGILLRRTAGGDVSELGRVEIDSILHEQIAARAKSMEGGGLMLPLKEATRHRTAPSSSNRKGKGIAAHDGGDDDDEVADEDAINSDLDDPDEDRDDDEVEDEGLGHIMLCMYDKVQRVKNKWKCTLKDGVLTVNGKEYVFHKATGEYEW